MMYTVEQVDETKLRMIVSSFTGLSKPYIGNIKKQNDLADLGNNVMDSVSMEVKHSLDNERKRVLSFLKSEIDSRKIRVVHSEKGLIISLSVGSFYKEKSDEINMELARDSIQKISQFLMGLPQEFDIHIEGHTDSIPIYKKEKFKSNWILSIRRATSLLHYLSDYGVNEKRMQVFGFSDTCPLFPNDTPESMAYNKRVDVVIVNRKNHK